VIHPTYHVPTLYFTACHVDGTPLTLDEVMMMLQHTFQQYQQYHFQSSLWKDDEANNNTVANYDSGDEYLHMNEQESNYYDNTEEVELLHFNEFISYEEHPITGNPCYCIHPCHTTERMQYILSSASIVGTASSGVMMEEEEEEKQHDQCCCTNVNATTTTATTSVPLLSWMSMILPIVGCCLSSYTYEQLVISVLEEKQKMQQQYILTT
jgi:hypothetical protein